MKSLGHYFEVNLTPLRGNLSSDFPSGDGAKMELGSDARDTWSPDCAPPALSCPLPSRAPEERRASLAMEATA